MAQRTITTTSCDLGHKHETAADTTVAFGFEGTEYEIDLCGQDEKVFREDIGRFRDHARKAGTPRRGVKRRTARNRRRSEDIRAWAARRGIELPARGRIPNKVHRDYEASH